MTQNDKNTEDKILIAAMDIFSQKGKSGARMQEIADKAGINKALLHYYYRSKDRLFEAVFTIVIKQLVLPRVFKIFNDEDDIFEIIRKFVGFYIDTLIKNSFLVFFVIEEINKNPERLSETFLKSGVPIEQFLGNMQKAMDDGLIRKMDPRQILANIMSLCIFPFVAKPFIERIIFHKNKTELKNFLEARRTEVADFIIYSIKTDKA